MSGHRYSFRSQRAHPEPGAFTEQEEAVVTVGLQKGRALTKQERQLFGGRLHEYLESRSDRAAGSHRQPCGRSVAARRSMRTSP
jgi:hypothetical protein